MFAKISIFLFSALPISLIIGNLALNLNILLLDLVLLIYCYKYNHWGWLNDKIFKLLNNESNVYDIIEDQELLMDELKIKINKLKVFNNFNIYSELNDQLSLILSRMETLLDSLNENSDWNEIFETNQLIDNMIIISDDILTNISSIEFQKEGFMKEIELMEIQEEEDKFKLF